MRIVFTGGGTGGHILPNIAVSRELKKRDPKIEIFWIGGKGGIEERFCRTENIRFFGITTGKWRRYFDIKNFIDFFRVPMGVYQSLKILRRVKPDKVFAKGGYVSFPAGVAAAMLKIPLFLHESDATPGVATKMLAPFAEKIFLGFEPASYFFAKQKSVQQKSKVHVTGTPVREEVLRGRKEEALRLTGFSGQRPVILILGGSLGAAPLNNLVWQSLTELAKFCDVIHLTGKGKGKTNFPNSKFYYALEYADETLPHLYALADLFITRAGASVLSEIIALRKPHILFPLGMKASRGDQWANAKFFRENFGSLVFADDIAVEKFVSEVRKNLQKENLQKFRNAISEAASQKFRNCAAKISDSIIQLKTHV